MSELANLSPLISKKDFATRLYSDFESPFSTLTRNESVDAFIVGTETGFSPLGANLEFFAEELNFPRAQIAFWADWNRFENDRVTLVAIKSKKPHGLLRGIILAPGERSKVYKDFQPIPFAPPYRDFYYNVTYEAIAYASSKWNARHLAISHLSGTGFHEDIATCNAEALAHFCDEATAPVIDRFTFVGCCITTQHLAGIGRLNAEGKITRHTPIQIEKEIRDDVELIHLAWR